LAAINTINCPTCYDPGHILVIDGGTDTVSSDISNPDGPSPRAVAVNSVTNKIYVANSIWPDAALFTGFPGNVTVIDGSTDSGPTIGKIKGIMHAVYQYGVFEEFCSSNPCSGWRLRGVKSGYKAILVTPQQTVTILKSMTDLLHCGGDSTSCKRSDVASGVGHLVEGKSYPRQQAMAERQRR
jgi:hypothetical protein